MQTTRPVFLDLWRIKLPISGIVSILHRISGILMVLTIPVAALLFHRALSAPEGFVAVAALLDTWPARLLLLVLTWSLLHHLFAGIRYLLLDLGFGLERAAARLSARIVLIVSLLVLALVIIGGLLR
ncbi:MAG: succinate dehydrogenase, cytochrome b556 subunit [Sphingobacteriia bacterium]|nr:succinate dehydrogenase, cytochrome b556 subunit [Sphingobacteriia bacterium]NCC40841.1 succinate dehydrogenase, cytochrome b556 subunit [Gammaproteobacteria bacterium]